MNKLRWGIVGPGNIARKFAAACKNIASCELYGVASRSYEKGRAFAETYGIPAVFGSYEEMAASPLIDCVYIATPHPFHKPCAEIFLRAGKHVLSEKPLCVNAAEARTLAALAKECGCFLMEAMWTRFLPAVNGAIEAAKSGEIGRIVGLSADFCYSSNPENDRAIFSRDMAGGGLLDVGVYGLHFAAMLFGTSPCAIQAAAALREGVDTHMQAILTYEGGEIASISSGTMVRKPEDAFIYGSNGYIRVPRFYGADSYTVVAGGKERTVTLPFLGNGFEEEILEVVRCVGEGLLESDRHPLSTTIAVLEEMDEIRGKIGVSYPFDKENS